MPKYLNVNFLWLFCFLIGGSSFAQIKRGLPIGSWRQHTPYSEGLDLCFMAGKIYVATPSGLFYYDLEDQLLGTLNKINGLSRIGITCMRKHPDRDLIMIGFEDGAIDVLDGNSIYSLKDILISSNIIGSKKINNIKIYGNDAYVCGAFGMVIYNISKREVRESNLALGDIPGQTVNVRDCAVYKDSIYAVTNEGLKVISRFGEFKNTSKWQVLGNESGFSINAVDPKFIADVVNGRLFIGTSAGFYQRRTNAMFFDGKPVQYQPISIVYFDNQYFTCNTFNDLLAHDTSFAGAPEKLTGKIVQQPNHCIKVGNSIWVSDSRVGLVQIIDSNTSLEYHPNSPLSKISFSLFNFKDQIISNSGGYSIPSGNGKNNNGDGFSIFKDNEWINYNNRIDSRVPLVGDVTSTMYNPFDKNLYFSTFGYGLLLKNEDTYQVLNDVTTNTGLCNVVFDDCIYNPGDLGARDFVNISSSAVDAFGHLWVSNFEAGVVASGEGSIRHRDAEGVWQKSIILTSENKLYPFDILVDKSNYKWIRMAPARSNNNAGIWVLNEDASKTWALNTNSNQGALPSADVYDMKEDKQGYIWVGTAKGLCVFYNPFNVFYEGRVTASTPIYPPEAGRPVLENDVVTAIEIDGGNRKWVGTKENGIWLFNHDITKVIHHFTKDNSPLLSDYIYDLAVNKATGELFVSTDKGLISYQSDATENLDGEGNLATDQCNGQDVNVFPNPVMKNYEGLISVKGLASNSQVKFVTPSGKLVYETTAIGGMATWNGKTYDGKQAHPGIYVILSSTIDGTANCVSKLAILD